MWLSKWQTYILKWIYGSEWLYFSQILYISQLWLWIPQIQPHLTNVSSYSYEYKSHNYENYFFGNATLYLTTANLYETIYLKLMTCHNCDFNLRQKLASIRTWQPRISYRHGDELSSLQFTSIHLATTHNTLATILECTKTTNIFS